MQYLLQCRLADALGADHGSDFLLGFYRAKCSEKVARAFKLKPKLLFPAEKCRVTQALILRRNMLGIDFIQSLPELHGQRVSLIKKAYLSPFGLLLCRLDIAGVGNQKRLIPANQHGPVGKGKACGIALVLFVGNKQRIKIASMKFFADSCDLIHMCCPSSVELPLVLGKRYNEY